MVPSIPKQYQFFAQQRVWFSLYFGGCKVMGSQRPAQIGVAWNYRVQMDDQSSRMKLMYMIICYSTLSMSQIRNCFFYRSQPGEYAVTYLKLKEYTNRDENWSKNHRIISLDYPSHRRDEFVYLKQVSALFTQRPHRSITLGSSSFSLHMAKR